GREAQDAIERARAQVARLIGAQSDEIVFTGSGTEATNYAIKGVVFAASVRKAGLQVVISSVEHPATVEAARFVEPFGPRVVVADVDRYGVVDLDGVARALKAPTLLVS